MKIRNVEMEDDDYSDHMKGECDINCQFCIEEQEEIARQEKKNQKKDEGKRS